MVRNPDGTLVDAASCRPLTVAELGDDLRQGRRFTVTDQSTGADCTYRILAQALLAALGPVLPDTPPTATADGLGSMLHTFLTATTSHPPAQE
ncbi:hypothetical protein [Streptomyces sp. NPDC018045]|uniref:hypothetical protein n=1 Tax=Streptomyces sp. NPDC018045 TaxID=3365037 RepID=UPI00379030C2